MAKVTLPPISGNVRAGLINSNAQPDMRLAQGLAMAGEVVGQLAEKQEKLKTEKYNARASIAMYDIKTANSVLKDSFDKQAPMTSLDDLDPENKDGLLSRLTKENDKIFNESIKSLNPEDQKAAIAKRNIDMRAFKQYASNKHAMSLNDARGAAASLTYKNSVLFDDETADAALLDLKASYPQTWETEAAKLKQVAAYDLTNTSAGRARTPSEITEATALFDRYKSIMSAGQRFNVNARLNANQNAYTKEREGILIKASNNAIKGDPIPEESVERLLNSEIMTQEEIDGINKKAAESKDLKQVESEGKEWLKSPRHKAVKIKIEDIFSSIEPSANPEANKGKFKEINEYINTNVTNEYAKIEMKKYSLQLLSLATGDEDFSFWSAHYGEKLDTLQRGDTKDAQNLSYLNSGIERMIGIFDAYESDADVSSFATSLEDDLYKFLKNNPDAKGTEIDAVINNSIYKAAGELLKSQLRPGSNAENVDEDVPEGVTPEEWSAMTESDRELWR